ncbi:MAG: bifunctional phosphoglucose/phosphomannose isomerase [Chthonomonadaceae bacterium]|nr:bifunctional phosphoglucose/phosphomannose isomerase [Chthonomonadaceae bacterium]
MSHLLDDRKYVLRNDPKDMYGLTMAFPDQCARALEIATQSNLPTVRHPHCVVLTGLGGSAAGGDLTRALFEFDSAVPFLVNRDYTLPKWAGPNTLVFATSYSGNTEETLSAYRDASAKGCQIVCVTSGGELASLAQRDGHPLVTIPSGQPPRTALGFLFVPVAAACERFGLLPQQNWTRAFDVLQSCAKLWSVETPYDDNEPKQVADALFGNVSVLYGLGFWQGLVAGRWKGQICENAKNMTFAHTFPELCHNEVLGWVEADKQGVASWVSVVLQDGQESPKMKKRAEVTARLIHGVAQTLTVTAVGDSLLEKMLSLTYYGDFVSLYLAALNGVDPENIDSINILKSELAKVD